MWIMSTRNTENRRGDFDRSKPFIIPVFLPHRGCAHRCVFCNQHTVCDIGGQGISAQDLPVLIERWLEYRGARRGHTQISFFGGNFLGLESDLVAAYLDTAARFVGDRRVDSLRFSTRPDTIDSRTLDLIGGFPVRTIELGVQSMDDGVLQRCQRGHTREDTFLAVKKLATRGYEIGLQLMIGLPGETASAVGESARAIAALKPAFVRIYPTLVLSGSRLAAWYASGDYRPLCLERSVEWVKNLFLFFYRRRIPVVRMGLQASANLANRDRVLAGPYHPAFGHLVYAAVFFDMARRLISEQRNCGRAITLHVHPGNASKLAGLKNMNIQRLRDEFGLSDIRIRPQPDVAPDSLILDEGVGRIRLDQLEVGLPCGCA